MSSPTQTRKQATKSEPQAHEHKGVPTIFKKDDQIYVREPDGKEYQGKLSKTDDGKIICEYSVIDELTGGVHHRRIPLRKKAKPVPEEPTKEQQTANESSRPVDPQSHRGADSSRLKRAKSMLRQKSKDSPREVVKDAQDEIEEDITMGLDMEDLERHQIVIKDVLSSAEELVLQYLPDDYSPTVGDGSLLPPPHAVHKETKKQGKTNDPWERAFRWKDPEVKAEDSLQPIVAYDDFEGVEAREQGIEPSSFDVAHYNQQRLATPFVDVVPTRLKTANISKSPDQMTPGEQINSINEMYSCKDVHKVIYIRIEQAVRFSKTTELQFLSTLCRFVNCEVLILRGLGIKRIEFLKFPKLRAADFIGNHVSEPYQLMSFVKNCPMLFQVDTRQNPIERKPYIQPLLAEALSLVWVSGNPILEPDRLNAIAKLATPETKRTFRAMRLWENALLKVPTIASMTRWTPWTLKHLKLSNLGIEAIFVGSLQQLVSLDVSSNKITSLEKSGLEHLSSLVSLNVSKNQLGRTQDLEMFQWIPSLQSLVLSQNQWPENYKYRVLWACRNLRGSNHWPGLNEIDGVHVKRVDIVEAWRLFGGQTPAQLDRLNWQLTMVNYLGHYHLRIPDFPMRVAKLNFPKKRLTFADVSAFRNLQILDLSDNEITNIVGLEKLDILRSLDLSRNPRLNVKAILNSLKSVVGLWEISLATTPNQAKDVAFRGLILGSLFHHPHLRMIDGKIITMEERLAAFSRVNPKAPIEDRGSYALNLKILVSAVSPEGRKYTPSQVEPGKQWQPESVTKLTDLSFMRLTNQAVDRIHLNMFTNLKQLNLSHNNIQNVIAFQLNQLRCLEILDVSFNNIHNPIPQLAAYFDGFPSLEVLCLRGNNSYNTLAHRVELIGKMTSMQSIDCKLRVVDIPVGVAERMDAWRQHGGKAHHTEELKLQFQLNERLPLDLPHEEVISMNLNRAELRAISNLNMFSCLQSLTLKDNALESLEPIKQLPTLRILDVRNNKIPSVKVLTDVANSLPLLEVLAASGNTFNSGARAEGKYRSSFVRHVPKLKKMDNILTYLDDVEISPEEIANGAFATPKTPQETLSLGRWILATSIWRLVRRVKKPTTEIEEMDLSYKGLTTFEVEEDMFPRLKRLMLQGNKLGGACVMELLKLPMIEEVDLSSNQIAELSKVTSVVDQLPNLRLLNMTQNPCFRDNIDAVRAQFLSRLLQIQYLGAPLKYLNGYLIQVDERIKGLELARFSGFDERRIRTFRTELALEAVHANVNLKNIAISGFDLKVLNPIEAYTMVEFLDLSDNALETLINQGIDKLPNLFWLDLRNNSFRDLQENLLKPLTASHKLRHIYVQNATKTGETSRVNDYIVNPVCHTLRGLESCDQNKNPIKLDENGEKGADYLYEKYGLSRNSLLSIDLNGREIEAEDFPRFCTALSYVYCEKLRCDQNPWVATPNYRFMLIYFGEHLVELDGKRVQMDERANAQRTVSAMRLNKKLFLLEKGTDFSATKGKDMNKMVDKLLLMPSSARGKSLGVVSSAGTTLTKWEIFINFLQVFASLFTLTIKWPNWWYDLNIRWIYIVNIDIDLEWLQFLDSYKYVLKFVVLVLLPVIIFFAYKIDPSSDLFHSYFVTQYKTSVILHFIEIYLIAVFSLMFAFIIDYVVFSNLDNERTSWDRVGSGLSMRGLCSSIFGITFAGLMFLWLIRQLIMTLYRWKHTSKTFWFEFIKTKKRVALFMLTVLYQPIARNVLTHFAEKSYKFQNGVWFEGKRQFDFPPCMTASEQNDTFSNNDLFCCQAGMPDRPCLHSGTDLEWFHYISIFLCVVYTLGIPWTVFKLIKQGTSEIDYNYNVPTQVQESKDRELVLKQQLAVATSRKEKKSLKKQIKVNRRNQRVTWAKYCRNYVNAQNYLYFSFTREKRYTKVKIMIEKLFLVVVILFFSAEAVATYRTVAGVVIVGVSFLSVLITQPYSDIFEDFMDVSCRLTNSVNGFVGVIGVHFSLDDKTRDVIQSLMLSLVNLGNLVVVILVFIGAPIAAWWSHRRALREESKKPPTTRPPPLNDDGDMITSPTVHESSRPGSETGSLLALTQPLPQPPPPPSSQTMEQSTSSHHHHHHHKGESELDVIRSHRLGDYEAGQITSVASNLAPPAITRQRTTSKERGALLQAEQDVAEAMSDEIPSFTVNARRASISDVAPVAYDQQRLGDYLANMAEDAQKTVGRRESLAE